MVHPLPLTLTHETQLKTLKTKTNRETVPVLDEPVVFAVGSSIAHSQHTVVQADRAAFRVVVDARLVELEGAEGGVDGYGDGTHGGHGGPKRLLTVSWDIRVPHVRGTHVGSFEVALSVLEEG